MVPGLSSSSSSTSHPSTSRTPSRKESNRPTSSSSSSTSPTTTSSGSATPERDDPSGIDSHPLLVSSPNVEEMIERRDPLFAQRSEIPEWLQEFRENLVDDRVPQHRDSHASSSHEVSLEPTYTRSEDLGKQCLYSLP